MASGLCYNDLDAIKRCIGVLLPAYWATPEDFAALFQYFWNRDFPISERATGARRIDWTIHIGVVVRNIADLMGLIARFERGGRKDAILRCGYGDEIAVEWEWGGVSGNELDKLKHHKVWSKDKKTTRPLRFAALITYTETPEVKKVHDVVAQRWQGAAWPLLLILIDVARSRMLSSGRQFNNIQMSVFDPSGRRELRSTPAVPWRIEGSRWYAGDL